MESKEDARRWRKALRRLGTPSIRVLLQPSRARTKDDSDIEGVVEKRPHPSRGFVESWYQNALRRAERFKRIRLNIIAVVVLLGIAAGLLVFFFMGY